MELQNPYLGTLFDSAQREEIPELVRNAPETTVGGWLRQQLPEYGGSGHIPTHVPDFLIAVVAVLCAAHNDLRAENNDLRGRVEELEDHAERLEELKILGELEDQAG